MQGPVPPRRAATAGGGATVGPAEVDDADTEAMAAMFEAVLPGLFAGEARRRLAAHGWDLQAALAGAAREDPARPLFDGAPLGRGTGAAVHAAQPERGEEAGHGGLSEDEEREERGRSVGEEREEGNGDTEELVELRLRVHKRWDADETEETVRVRPDAVDLSAHTGLVALPVELRACAGRVRALKVRSGRLEALPVWREELTGLTELRLTNSPPLRELPDAVGQLANLRALELQGCSKMTALPDAVSRLKHCNAIGGYARADGPGSGTGQGVTSTVEGPDGSERCTVCHAGACVFCDLSLNPANPSSPPPPLRICLWFTLSLPPSFLNLPPFPEKGLVPLQISRPLSILPCLC